MLLTLSSWTWYEWHFSSSLHVAFNTSFIPCAYQLPLGLLPLNTTTAVLLIAKNLYSPPCRGRVIHLFAWNVNSNVITAVAPSWTATSTKPTHTITTVTGLGSSETCPRRGMSALRILASSVSPYIQKLWGLQVGLLRVPQFCVDNHSDTPLIIGPVVNTACSKATKKRCIRSVNYTNQKFIR